MVPYFKPQFTSVRASEPAAAASYLHVDPVAFPSRQHAERRSASRPPFPSTRSTGQQPRMPTAAAPKNVVRCPSTQPAAPPRSKVRLVPLINWSRVMDGQREFGYRRATWRNLMLAPAIFGRNSPRVPSPNPLGKIEQKAQWGSSSAVGLSQLNATASISVPRTGTRQTGHSGGAGKPAAGKRCGGGLNFLPPRGPPGG